MKNLSPLSLFILFIVCLSGSTWLGSYITKLIISYRLFEETEFVLKNYLNENNLEPVLRTMLPAFAVPFVLYPVFIISFILFLIISKLKLKMNGWLFITAILILVTLPFEIWLMGLDYKIITMVNSDYFNSLEVINLITKRFTVLGSFPLIEVFCYLGIIFLFVYRPLTQKDQNIAV